MSARDELSVMLRAQLAGALRGASRYPGQAIALVVLGVAFQITIPAALGPWRDASSLWPGAVACIAFAWGTWWAHAGTVLDARHGAARWVAATVRYAGVLAVASMLASEGWLLGGLPGTTVMAAISCVANRPSDAPMPSLAARLRAMSAARPWQPPESGTPAAQVNLP